MEYTSFFVIIIKTTTTTKKKAFKPQVDPYLVKLEFVPVKIHFGRKLKSSTLFVVEIHVNKGRAPIYFSQGQKAYLRLNGSVRQMDQSTINDRLSLGRPLKSGKFNNVKFFPTNLKKKKKRKQLGCSSRFYWKTRRN